MQGLNIRDMADVPQLTVLANLESHNADLIRQGLSAKDRVMKLRDIAIMQLKTLRSLNYNFSTQSPHAIDLEQNEQNPTT